MTSPEPTIALEIVCEAFVEIAVIDDEMRKVALPAAEAGRIVVQVRPGTYEITFRAVDAVETQFVSLTGVEKKTIVHPKQPLQFSSAAPLRKTETTREYQRLPATDLASQRNCSGKGTAALFLFVRDVDEKGLKVRAPGGDVTVLSEDGRSMDLRKSPARWRDDEHWAGLHCLFSPGSARLQIKSRERTYEQSLALIDGYQTQAFLLAERSKSEDEARVVVSSLSILIAERGSGFDPESEGLRRTELALRALASGRKRGLGGSELIDAVETSPLLAIAGAHLIIQGDVQHLETGFAETLIRKLHDKLGSIPDVVALRLALRLKLGTDSLKSLGEVPALDALPMLYKSWKRWVQASQDDFMLIPPGSPGDRIGTLAMANGPWLAWKAGALEHTVERTVPNHFAQVVQQLQDGLHGGRWSPETVSKDHRFGAMARQLVQCLALPSQGHEPFQDHEPFLRSLRAPRATAYRAASELLSKLEADETLESAVATNKGSQ